MQPPLPRLTGGKFRGAYYDDIETDDGFGDTLLDPSFFDVPNYIPPGGINPIITPPSPGFPGFFTALQQASQGVRDTALDIYKTKYYLDALKAQDRAGFVASPYYVANPSGAAFGIGGLDMKWVLLGGAGLVALMLLKDRK